MQQQSRVVYGHGDVSEFLDIYGEAARPRTGTNVCHQDFTSREAHVFYNIAAVVQRSDRSLGSFQQHFWLMCNSETRDNRPQLLELKLSDHCRVWLRVQFKNSPVIVGDQSCSTVLLPGCPVALLFNRITAGVSVYTSSFNIYWIDAQIPTVPEDFFPF